MGDLGDLGDFLKTGGVANLDWLDVNEEEYRELDKLPQQNLDHKIVHQRIGTCHEGLTIGRSIRIAKWLDVRSSIP